jgi:hypothetical protein
VTMDQATYETTCSDRRRLPGALRSSASCLVPTPGAPNKPMVPTAPASLAVNPSRPLGPHIVQSVGQLRQAAGGEPGRARPGLGPNSIW